MVLCNQIESRMRFSDVRCPLVTKEGMPMNIMEVLTLLLVIFAALSYLDNRNNKKK